MKTLCLWGNHPPADQRFIEHRAIVMGVKKVATEKLAVGMYVHDLNCGWIDHDFVRNHFKISSEKQIAKIHKHGIREVYIDTDRGSDVHEAIAVEEVEELLEQQFDKLSSVATPPTQPVVLSMEEELKEARKIARRASSVIHSTMANVIHGRELITEEVKETVDDMVSSVLRNHDAMLSLMRIRNADEYSYQHSVSVASLMIAFCDFLGYDRDKLTEIGTGALLHDIGKMLTDPEVLNKPGRLTKSELIEMRSHVVHSDYIIGNIESISADAHAVAAQHHERYDGSGYPHQLAGDDINHFAQMAAIVDVYDAITSDRCYHKGQTPTETLRKLLEWSSYHFNETLVHQFIRCVGIYPAGSLVKLESNRLAVVVEMGEKGPLYPLVRVIREVDSGRYITPIDIDLSHPNPRTGDDRILEYASPSEWGIKPEEFLDSGIN